MFIKKLHIYGFGKIVDQEFELSSGLQVFYGENEAGKTTIMSFIHSILFGFPTKNQTENRYEPRNGMKYGGKLTVETKHHREITIERVAGKATGDVKVYFENGSVGYDKELSDIMHGMNRRLFSSIFSFGLQGLQEIQTIKTDDLSNYLFSSSILGNEQILELEKKIGREMDALFKPTGKKPEINQILDETSQLSQQVQAAKAQIVDYQNLSETELKNEQELKEITAQMEQLSSLEGKLTLFEQYVPLQNEVFSLRKRRKEMGDKPVFPVDGIKRFEQVSSHLLPTEARLMSLSEKYEEQKTKALSIFVNEDLVNAEMDIKDLAKHYHRIELAKDSSAVVNMKIEVLQEEIATIKRKLGIKVSDTEIAQVELTMSVKEEIRALTHQFSNVRNKKEVLDQQQEQIKLNIEASESNVIHYSDQLLEDSQKKEMEDILHNQSQYFTTEKDQQKTLNKHARITKQIDEFERRTQKILLIRNALLFPLSFCLLFYGIWNLSINSNSVSYSFILFAAALFAVVFLLTGLVRNNQYLSLLKEEQAELQQKIIEWDQFERFTQDENYTRHAQQLLAKDIEIQKILQKEKMLLQQFEKEFERCIDQFEKWEDSSAEISAKFVALHNQLHIPQHYGYELVMDHFEQLEKLVGFIHQFERMTQEKQKLEEEINHYARSYYVLLQRVKLDINDISPHILVKLLEEEKNKKQQMKAIEEKLIEIKETIDQYNKEIQYINEQILTLFSTAEVNLEEDFRNKASLLDEWIKLEERISNLKDKIKLLLKNNEILEQEFCREWIYLNDELGNKDIIDIQWTEYKQKEKALVTELAETSLQKRQLEEKGTYSSLLQLLETKKSELNDQAKRWAKLAVAKDVLLQTKDYYRKVRLPQVIVKAESYFSILTNGAYIHLFSHEETSDFIVERKDGTRFAPQELSQATSEQLYLSLRVALASYYQSPEILPFIVDDGFVNFDEGRFKVSMELLKELSKERQVLFFTCHKQAIRHIGEQEKGITYLTRNEVRV
ncbi:AAA family ATPase [Bacillus sp. DJP31]|uniref:ATP-binding protein n=1 Tax=Bacillus sp. DJP31 TaxID=3409789 RepID=UPI003BB5431D